MRKTGKRIFNVLMPRRLLTSRQTERNKRKQLEKSDGQWGGDDEKKGQMRNEINAVIISCFTILFP